MSSSYRIAQPGTIVSLLTDSVKPIFFLGAGASKQSGIRLVTEIVDEIAKSQYCKDNGIDVEDPRLTMSDWKKWLTRFSWYVDDYSQLYPIIVEELLNPRQARKDFFLRMMHPDVPASRGYEIIAELLHLQMLDTVLTTNFDDCLQIARTQVRKPSYIQQIKTPSDLSTFSYTPRYAQQVFLHGSVEHYTDQNLKDEIQTLNVDLVSTLKPILKDRPLVIIGYRGAEPSVMNDLFLKNLSYTKNFHQGIYWCMLKKEVERLQADESSVPSLFLELCKKTNGNFHIIPIDGFDELMVTEIWGKLRANEIDLKNVKVNSSKDSNSPTYDTSLIGTDTIGELEIALLRERISNYCARLGVKVYADDDWLYQQMLRLRVAELTKGKKYELTRSGVLIFSSRTQQYIPHAYVKIRFLGDPLWLNKIKKLNEGEDFESGIDGSVERIIGGNIWSQLNEITEILTSVNQPFRLKGEISENVYPYPTLALKEIIVNSLVHRDYSLDEPVLIDVYHDHISFISPGGLVEEVKRQLASTHLEEEIRRGKRGIKGYRNPVLADIFYGAGAMDKEGSGLSDVVNQVNQNGGAVTFGTSKDESHFEAKIYRRTEVVDEATSTAIPSTANEVSRFACNLLEIIELPESIYHGETTARKEYQIWKAIGEKIWYPPFLLHRERLWSFYNLSDRRNPLGQCVDQGTVEKMSIDEFVSLNGGTKELVRMFNDCLVEYLFSIGLRVEKWNKRAYFTKTMEGTAKEITYQGRFKKATRTVAKPRINSSTGNISYWEHKSIWFGTMQIGSKWYIYINPSYVFTTDGIKTLLKSERVNVLSTRRASRDYNLHVHNDLTFWSHYLSNGQEEVFSLRPNIRGENKEMCSGIETPRIILSAKLPSVAVNQAAIAGNFEPDEHYDLEDLDLELEQLAKEEQEKSNVDEHKD